MQIVSSQRDGSGGEIRMSEVIAALSYALDLTEGQPEGHAARSCLLGMRIARELKFDEATSSALFYGLLLKDLGCSSNASKMCYLFGADDRAAKRDVKTVEWTSTLRSAGYATRTVMLGGSLQGGSLLDKAGKLVKLALTGSSDARELIGIRCERGAKIAHDLQMPDETAAAIRALDEHWDGRGHPAGLKGEQIPLLGRILGISQTVEVFASRFGVDAAYEMARERGGTWFDPALVDAMNAFRNDTHFWQTFAGEDPKHAVTEFEPKDRTLSADQDTLDRIAFGFAQVIDAKSPWTYKHSEGVSKIASGIAVTMGMTPFEVRRIRRAGLLHDVGKLGVSNLILDKPGKLDAVELAEMRKHPAYTLRILDQVTGFRDLAELAASHHERLDGKGYHRGLTADQLDTAARILVVSDMYEALAAKRPYRKDLSEEEVMTILTKNTDGGICPEVFAALKTYLARGGYAPSKIAA
jgi:putative nucleotidyltransferase with HDIG domain